MARCIIFQQAGSVKHVTRTRTSVRNGPTLDEQHVQLKSKAKRSTTCTHIICTHAHKPHLILQCEVAVDALHVLRKLGLRLVQECTPWQHDNAVGCSRRWTNGTTQCQRYDAVPAVRRSASGTTQRAGRTGMEPYRDSLACAHSLKYGRPVRCMPSGRTRTTAVVKPGFLRSVTCSISDRSSPLATFASRSLPSCNNGIEVTLQCVTGAQHAWVHRATDAARLIRHAGTRYLVPLSQICC